MIRYDFTTYNKKDVSEYHTKVTSIREKLTIDVMSDWLDVNKCIMPDELELLIKTSNEIRNTYDTLVVVGIGGSYLGAKAVIDALTPYFAKNDIEIIFAGNSLSAAYHSELIEYLKNKNYIINVVSKSGSTLESNLAFELLRKELISKYDYEEARKRIIITTDQKSGYLRNQVNEHKYLSFTIPKNIGGRFSVLTAAGLLPIAVAGIDVKELLEGARGSDKVEAFRYAFIRDKFYRDGHYLESFTVYEPKLLYFTEWLKQLFAESQGKENKGIMPISAINTRDLHSLGQYFQEGSRILFETVIGIENYGSLRIDEYNLDLNEINNIALESVALAHKQDHTLSNIIKMDELNARNIGDLIYFFELSAAVGGYLLNVNPFDQPGVSKYKEIINKELEARK
ncbi:MAG: glucose-6-phosphate isomerase [Mollicutes bacterium]|jgi:glucose-6-phosphate isomerase|nr:glucose-6-phosphate isomerase [Mollicutes bacterium]